MTNRAIFEAVVSVSQKFESRFGHQWVASNDPSDRDDLREKITNWSVELDAEKIDTQTILDTANALLKKDEFRTFPPTLNHFVLLCKEMQKLTDERTGNLYLEIKRMGEKFAFCYGRLWKESDIDKDNRKLEFWKQRIEEEGISANCLRKAVRIITSKSTYSQYPPSLNQFLMECQFIALDESFINPDIAFHEAKSGSSENIIIAVTKGKVGSFSLRSSTDKSLKPLFIRIYLEECEKYIADKESYIAEHKRILDKAIESEDEKIEPFVDCTDFFAKLTEVYR